MISRNILVIGGSGFVGSAIVRKLVAGGRRVVVPTRRRERAKHLIVLPTVDVVEIDVHDDAALAGLVAGKDAVVNLVGILHGDQGQPYGKRFQAAHVDLPRRVAAACTAAAVSRLLHMSALGVSIDAPSMYLRSKAAGEAAVREAAGSTAVTMFRPSVIFGRDDRFLNLFARMQEFLPLMALGRPDSRLQPVYVEDVASAFVNALDNRATFGRTYDLAGPKAYTLRDIIAFAGRASGHPRPVIGLPDSLAYLQAWLMEFAPVELISRDNLDSLAVDSVSTAAFPAELDVQAASMEAVMTDILAQHTPRERYMKLRDHAGR
jgi:uncharacterized protein YbjT (DUF2867 family)